MKKLFTFALVLVLCMSFSTPAFAATVTGAEAPGNTETHNVLATVTDNTTTVYSINIMWGSLQWSYTESKGTWNPETFVYDNPQAGAWAAATPGITDKVTIANSSNAPIVAEVNLNPTAAAANLTIDCKAGAAAEGVAYKDNTNNDILTGATGLATIDIASADTGAATGTVRTASCIVDVTGTPTAAVTTNDTILATLTVVISAINF